MHGAASGLERGPLYPWAFVPVEQGPRVKPEDGVGGGDPLATRSSRVVPTCRNVVG